MAAWYIYNTFASLSRRLLSGPPSISTRQHHSTTTKPTHMTPGRDSGTCTLCTFALGPSPPPQRSSCGGCLMYNAFRVLETANYLHLPSAAAPNLPIATNSLLRRHSCFFALGRKTKSRAASNFFSIFRSLWLAAFEKAWRPHTGTGRSSSSQVIDGRHNCLIGQLR
jgi:hypothetical protein